MQRESCEICGREMQPHTHYVVRIDVFADPEMPQTSAAELAETDFDGEISKLMEEMKGMSADELQDQVHRRFEFKICRACQVRFLSNPLGKPRRVGAGRN
jgi:hypothetical protein